MECVEFKAKRVDDNREIIGYPFLLSGVSYMMPINAESLNDIYRIYQNSIEPIERK